MAVAHLTDRDINVLEKIKDPGVSSVGGAIIDHSLPRDPYVCNVSNYEDVVQRESTLIQTIGAIEEQLQISNLQTTKEIAVNIYKQCVATADSLVADNPRYASARNNRAQLLRRLYGDAMLLDSTADVPSPLIEEPTDIEKKRASATVLEDLDYSIGLLSPSSRLAPISPQAARTLSMAHTQRGTLYLKTARLLPDRRLDLDKKRSEATWTNAEFEEAAAKDLAIGGRYGNPLAKSLAVSVNPTAKLCGQIVREAIKAEYFR